jgi:hypothetical protein
MKRNLLWPYMIQGVVFSWKKCFHDISGDGFVFLERKKNVGSPEQISADNPPPSIIKVVTSRESSAVNASFLSSFIS